MGVAEAMYRRAFELRIRHYPAGDPNIAESARDLAALLRRMGRSGDAARIEARAGLH
jgi:hypothetical protein